MKSQLVNSFRAYRLLGQVLDGTLRQNRFDPVELELLLDIVDRPTKVPLRTLRLYQKFLARNPESSAHTLSEYLVRMKRRRPEQTDKRGTV